MTTPTAQDGGSTGDVLTALRAVVHATTSDPRQRGSLYRALLRRAALTSPGVMACALDARTKQTRSLDLIDAALIAAETGEHRRWIINIAPQEGKTSRVARGGTAWALARDPDRRVILASYTASLAAGSAAWVRDRLREAPWLGIELDPGMATRAEWKIAGREGGVRGVGAGGSVTGFPCNWLVIDDPLKGREEADSLTMRNKVWDWWTDDLQTRLSPDAVVIVIQTRWHEDDLTGRLLAEDAARDPSEREWRVLNIPAICDDPATDPLHRAEVGEPMPSVWGPKRWRQWEGIRARSPRTWAALYQGHPTPREGGIFRWDWITPNRIPAAPVLSRVVVGVDTTAGGGDEAGIVAAGRTGNGHTYVLADRSGQCTDLQQWRRAWLLALTVGADELVWEANLVTPMMRRAVARTWRRLVEQAQALADVGALDPGLDEDDVAVLVDAAVDALAAAGSVDDDVEASPDRRAALAAQIREVHPHAAGILRAPAAGPARVVEVHATRGKVTRAEPCAAAYEAGEVHHAGVFHGLEHEMTTWQPGQASPNRVDALVWAWTRLNLSGAASMRVPDGRLPGAV